MPFLITVDFRAVLGTACKVTAQIKWSILLCDNHLRGVAQLGSAPAFGANFWRRWASVGVDAVFGTVWMLLAAPSRDGGMAIVGRGAHAGDVVAGGRRVVVE